MIFSFIKQFKKKGVLGINARNGNYLFKYNQRRYFPLVDDKIKTKNLAQEHGIAVPELYGIIEYNSQLSKLAHLLAPYHQFVIKPAQGAGGDGIIVITGKFKEYFRRSNGSLISLDELQYHISCILSGNYSLGSHPDKAMIEYCIQADPVFEHICYQGVPDIRIIVLKGYPVMAMLRLPTRSSDGKANLHQGAIGVGIDLADGITHEGVWHDKIIDIHPDTLQPVANKRVPHWQKCLLLAAQCYEMTHLGYLGVDLILDREQGPLMIELNARPGLNIQLANHCGLEHKYKLIEQQTEKRTALERVIFSQEHLI